MHLVNHGRVRPALILIALTSLFTLLCLLVATSAYAQSGVCDQFPSGSAPATGYGASWNTLTSAREMLVTSNCTGSQVTFTVGSGAQNQYIYKARHFYKVETQEWIATELQGTFAEYSTDWLLGQGSLSGSVPTASPFFWVGYVCQWTGTNWKCGCRDSACATNYWQLQGTIHPGTSTGGTTGGSGSGSLPEEAPLPAPSTVHNVSNASQLTSAVDAASAGDHIVLANGNYGAITISKSFPANNRLVIRSQNLLGATMSALTIDGDGIIVSGIKVDRGSNESSNTLTINGSNVRFTRGAVLSGGAAILFGAGIADALIDHSEVAGFHDRGVFLDHPKDQNRITFARNWMHDMRAGGQKDYSFGFIWNDNNEYREENQNIIVRLNYIGPGGPPANPWSPDYIHHKGSGALYAFNYLDVGGGLLSQRFGIKARYIGNYAPKATMRMFDDLGWYYGNSFGTMQAPGGRSAYYDDVKNLWDSVGGYHAANRARYSGNKANSFVLGAYFNSAWCTTNAHPTLPDPLGAGQTKPAKSYNGVTYAGNDPNDPDLGLKIRAHDGPITEETATCIDWAQNVDSQPNAVAPSSWLTELSNQYPWISDYVPNPTSLTGGMNGAAPWSVAQSLTRGDATNPSVGPNRAGKAGLLP